MLLQDLDASRRGLLAGHAATFAETALKNIRREFPNFVVHVMHEAGDFPQRPRELHPAFFGSFDWHSCVQMHWLLVRLLRTTPESLPCAEIRAALSESLTARNLAAEAASFRAGAYVVRPYGWGWALMIGHELGEWDGDPDARGWSAAMEPLVAEIERAFLEFLPRSAYPSRRGEHSNTAFGLRLCLDFARRRADAGQPALLESLTDAVERWYAADTDYPAGWEPDATDFLSPALVEAELTAALWPRERALPWLEAFLPGIRTRTPASLFSPAIAADSNGSGSSGSGSGSDGELAHLHGLNLSRAWCRRRLAERLSSADPRVPVMLDAAARDAEAERAQIGVRTTWSSTGSPPTWCST